MWKVKLDNNMWLAENGPTADEDKALLLPDMDAVHEKLKKIRLHTPYKEAMVVAEFDDCP